MYTRDAVTWSQRFFYEEGFRKRVPDVGMQALLRITRYLTVMAGGMGGLKRILGI